VREANSSLSILASKFALSMSSGGSEKIRFTAAHVEFSKKVADTLLALSAQGRERAVAAPGDDRIASTEANAIGANVAL
jgi:hypothetical protein